MKGLPTLLHCTTKGLLTVAFFSALSLVQGLALPLPSFIIIARPNSLSLLSQGCKVISALASLPVQGRAAAAKARQCLLPPPPRSTTNEQVVRERLERRIPVRAFEVISLKCFCWLGGCSMTDAITQGAKMARDYWDQYICHNYSVLRKPQYKSTAKAGESEGQK